MFPFFFFNELFALRPNTEYFGLKNKSLNRNCNWEEAKTQVLSCLHPCCHDIYFIICYILFYTFILVFP